MRIVIEHDTAATIASARQSAAAAVRSSRAEAENAGAAPDGLG